MSPRFLSGVFFVVSGLSAFIIGGKNIKRFAPVTIFTLLIVTLVQTIAHRLNWWRFSRLLIPHVKGIDFSLILGPFLVGTIGIFSLTYRFGFRVYLIANVVLDSFFSYILIPFMERTGWGQLVRLTRTGVNGLMIATAIVVYPFQKWWEGTFRKKRKFFW